MPESRTDDTVVKNSEPDPRRRAFLAAALTTVAGLALWWPIVAPRSFAALGAFGTLGYVFLATIVPTIPAMMMVFSDWPLFRLYELAPRVWPHFTANDDIKLAGLSMKLIGDIPLWITARLVFRRAEREHGLANA